MLLQYYYFWVVRQSWLMLQAHLPITQKLAMLQLHPCNYLNNWRYGRHCTLEDFPSKGCILMKGRVTKSMGKKAWDSPPLHPVPSSSLAAMQDCRGLPATQFQVPGQKGRGWGAGYKDVAQQGSWAGAAAVERQPSHPSHILLLLPFHSSSVHLTPATRSVWQSSITLVQE